MTAPDVALAVGVRERKRRETFARIAQTGLRMFVADGYEATTLDAIAAASGISRRTFFSYFTSKEEILAAWQSGAGDAFGNAVAAETPDVAPLALVERALLNLVTNFGSAEFAAIDRLMRSTENLRARKQANYERQELAVFAALCRLWPAPEQRAGLRLTAMAAIGVLRLAIERWSDDGADAPIGGYLVAEFAALRGALAADSA